MLTNFQTILPRIQYFTDLAKRVEETPEEEKTGKDWFALNREYQKLRRNFAGLTEMERLPGRIFVVDPKREELMVKEANRLKIPVVALTDTNCDPEVVDYVIPGNDDAIRSIGLISRLVADADRRGPRRGGPDRGPSAAAGDRGGPGQRRGRGRQGLHQRQRLRQDRSLRGDAPAPPAAAPEVTAEDAPEPATEPADEAAAEEPLMEEPVPAEVPADEVVAEAPEAEAPAADVPAAEEAPAEDPPRARRKTNRARKAKGFG
jgi:small subunit ribosomal protein S2